MSVLVPDTARCLRCGYPLRGLPDSLCPECGTRFDPRRPETFDDPARPRRARPVRPLAPPSVFYVAFVCIALVPLVYVRSTLEGVFFFYEQLVKRCGYWLPLLLAVPMLDYSRRLAALWHRRRAGNPVLLEDFRQHIVRWRVLTISIVLLYATLLYPWPAALRFWLNWPAFAGRADTFLNVGSTPSGPQRVGRWPVQRIWGRGQGFVWFQLDGRRDTRYGVVRYTVPPNRVCSGDPRPRRWIAPGWYFEEW